MLRLKTSTFAWGIAVPLLAALAPSEGWAACDIDYTVQPGDTYYSISQDHYGTRAEWQTVYQANQAASGVPSLLPGNQLYIPCIGGGSLSAAAPATTVTEVEPTVATVAPTAPSASAETTAETAVESTVSTLTSVAPTRVEPERVYPENAEMRLLTGGNYAPFTDKTLPGQGLVTELVHAALDSTPDPVTYSVTWEDDWSQHLFPLLDEKEFDMGFPWLRPDCSVTPDHERCENFLFSEPLMLMPIMLFVRDDNQFTFQSDADVVGRSLCRPLGYFTHDLDRADRRWLAEQKITFVQGADPRDCFAKVMSGEVDAATVNLFLGASVILEMGLRNRVVPLEKPLSEEGLHVVISKRHWRGTTHLYRVNAGIAKLREDGRYQEIVSRHLELFQARLQ